MPRNSANRQVNDAKDAVSLAGKAAPAGRSVSRRAFLRSAGLAAAGVALGACVPDFSRPVAQRSGQKVQLVYQDWRTDWFPAMAQQMLEIFHATHPNIRVFYVPDPENLEDKMLAEMQAGTAADVFQGCCAHFPMWAQQGFTLDLRPYVNADLTQETIEDWDQFQYGALFTPDGKQYGLPKYHGALALYFNKGLFDKYFVNYPNESWTHDDYHAAMRDLTVDQNRDGQTDVWGSMLDISWDRIQVHVNAWGGNLVDPVDPSRCRMGDQPALEAMDWLRKRMWEDKVMATFSDVQGLGTSQAFASGRLAMVEDGSWALKSILSRADFRLGVAPLPAGPARRVTLATTDGFGIYAGTKHPDAAWELLKFLISHDYGRAMAKANFLQPARASLVDDWIGYVQDDFPEKTKGMNLGAFADGHLRGYSVVAEVFPNMVDARRIAQSAWDQIFTLGQAPVGIIEPAARQIEEAQRRTSGGQR
jgi:multiple sugar transport system substrate-binding protein